MLSLCKLLALLVILSGTCLATFTPQYETYTTYSVDDTYLYQTVVVDGSTTGDCYYTCNCNQYGCSQCAIPNCPANHTPSINNSLGAAGGWSTGPTQTM